MVDILLRLPNELHRRLTADAGAAGVDFEDYVRLIIETNRRASPVDIVKTSYEPLTDELVVKAAEIEAEYQRLGYTGGWRFVTCPYQNAGAAKLLLITLNPAGQTPRCDGWSQEAGSAYRIESWDGRPIGQSKLQRQVQALYQLLGLNDEEVFSAHYVPFRSPSWDTLLRRDEAEAFAQRLWAWLKPKLAFERVICIGKNQPARAMASLFDAKLEKSFSTGWGRATADRYRLPDGRLMIALPHLSRFSIFGRTQGEQALKMLFDA